LKPASASDDTLLARIARGEERALAAFYDRYARAAFSLAHAIAGDAVVAEQAVAEAFASFWRAAAAPATTASPASHLFSLVRAMALKKTKRAPGTGRFNEESIRPLTATQRRAIELAFFDGYTVRQIALQLDESENDVVRALRSALMSMRRGDASGAPDRDEQEATRT